MLQNKIKPVIRFSTYHPWIVITISFLITIFMAIPAKNLKIESDVVSLLPSSVKRAMKDSMPEQSTNYDNFVLMVSGKNLYTIEGLNLLEKTYTKLGKMLSVGKIVDPFSRTILEKKGSRLVLKKLSPTGKAPKTEEELKIFRKRLKESPFSEGLVTSKDRDVLVVYLFVPKVFPYLVTMEKINLVLKPLREKFTVNTTGTMSFSAETERFLTKDFSILLIFVLLTILGSYYLGFRSRRALFLPMLLVISGTVFSLGGMALAGFKLTMVSIVTPPLVLTLGSSYSIHVLNAYYRMLAKRKEGNKKEIIIDAVSGISGTVILASATTIIGLMSLFLASIEQTREFAFATSLGIFFAALLSLTFLPAFLSIQRKPENSKLNNLSNDYLSRFLNFTGPKIINGKTPALIIIAAILVSFAVIYPRISFNTSASKYYPQQSEVIRNNKNILSKTGGLEQLSITFTPKKTSKNYFLNPEILSNIHTIETKLQNIDNVSYLFSFPSYLSYAGKVMFEKKYNFKSKGLNSLIARLFKTAAGKESSYLVNKDDTQITTTIRIYNKKTISPVDEFGARMLIKDISGIVSENIDPGINWKINGLSLAFLNLSHQMRRDFLVSTITALIAIGIVAFLAFRSVMQSIFALIPLLTGIFSSLILMVIFKIPLDMTTIMVSCVSIGVGVDDSIHFLLQYHINKRLYADDRPKAILETLFNAGRPIILTTLSIVSGLLFLSFAKFQPIRYFGLLIVFTLSTAMLATLFLLPPLLNNKKNDKKVVAGEPGTFKSKV